MKTKSLILSLLFATTFSATNAQSRMTLEQAVYNGSTLKMNWTPQVNWMPDGNHYSKIEYDSKGNVQIVEYSAKDKQSSIVVSADKLINPATGKSIGVRSFDLSEDYKKVLIYTNTERVWRYDTRGDYWVLNRDNGNLRQLGKGLPESSLMFAKFNKTADKVAYVSRNNIYVEDLASSEGPKQITTNGCDTIVNGTFDWVYEEEFDCRDGFRWSADGKYIAYWQSNTSGTGWFDIINNVDSIYPTIMHFPYPKAGTTNSAVRVGYISVDGGATQWIDIPGDMRENYIPRMDFKPGTNTLLIQQMNRAQNTNKFWTYTVGNGSSAPSLLLTDSDKAWVETNDNIHWLKGNKEFLMQSERDGWRHIYRVSANGKKMALVTKGSFDVISIEGIDDANGIIYFIASPDNATQRYLYKTRIYGNGSCTRVSAANQPGQHTYQMSPNCQWAIHSYSTASKMPNAEMQNMTTGKTAYEVTNNDEAQKRYAALGLRDKEFLKVKSGDLMLDAWMIKPADFDETKKYPMLVYVYGEPASATVQDRWESTLFWQYVANQGFIVVSIENRGANSPRGREWRKCIYGEVGTFASEDQARGVQDLCRQFSFIDPSRVGITGWSGGGAQTLNSMFRYPDVFKTGAAIAFVCDQRLYDTIYQERYMNTPQNNPEGYRKGSPITYVDGLKGNLLLVHGTGDDNVHYQSCELLVNELVKRNKLFYQVSYPMRSHSISEGEGTSLHLRNTLVNFWKNNL